MADSLLKSGFHFREGEFNLPLIYYNNHIITIERNILKKGHIGFKVAPYQQLDHQRTLHSSFHREADWAGFYVAKTKNVAAGYRVDYQHPYGHTVTLIHDLKVLICKGPELENSCITGFAKARMIIDALPEDMKTSVIKLNSPLIPALGRLGFCYQGPHDDEGGIEIIIPNRLIAFVAMHEKIDFGVNKYF